MKYARGGMTSLDYLMEIQELEQKLKEREWISVKDRLPEKEGIYIAVIDETQYNPDCLWVRPIKYVKYGNQYRWWWFSEKMYTHHVTHWMPLPEYPESEDDADV